MSEKTRQETAMQTMADEAQRLNLGYESTQVCKHEGKRFLNTLDLPVCSDCFAIVVLKEGDTNG